MTPDFRQQFAFLRKICTVYLNYLYSQVLLDRQSIVYLKGSRIFHSADLLQSSVAVSCDMCHPHAANTHPETYPIFQTQLGRVVLLQDMIEWCIDNPVLGKHLELNDPRMRALEAYIMTQRSGTEMNYGQH